MKRPLIRFQVFTPAWYSQWYRPAETREIINFFPFCSIGVTFYTITDRLIIHVSVVSVFQSILNFWRKNDVTKLAPKLYFIITGYLTPDSEKWKHDDFKTKKDVGNVIPVKSYDASNFMQQNGGKFKIQLNIHLTLDINDIFPISFSFEIVMLLSVLDFSKIIRGNQCKIRRESDM